MEKIKFTEVVIKNHLYQKYQKESSSILLEEVANGTGGNIHRYADMVALSLWPSLGYELDGFEIKVSRSDMVTELQDVHKWEAVGKFCHRWWLVVGEEGIVKLEEIPPMWGVMCPSKSGESLRIKRPASKLTPEAPSMAFIASMVRKAHGLSKFELQQKYDEGYKSGKATADYREEAKRELNNLKNSLAQFEKASGIKIDEYNGQYRGQDIARWLDRKYQYEGLEHKAKQIKDTADGLIRIADILMEDCKAGIV